MIKSFIVAAVLSLTTIPVAQIHVDRAVAHHSASSGKAKATAALQRAGATQSEIAFAIRVCWRESRCTLNAVNQNHRTRDDSWGPWQINYYGNLRSSRIAFLGPPATNTASWDRAARNFLKFLRKHGQCHWNPPNYCAG